MKDRQTLQLARPRASRSGRLLWCLIGRHIKYRLRLYNSTFIKPLDSLARFVSDTCTLCSPMNRRLRCNRSLSYRLLCPTPYYKGLNHFLDSHGLTNAFSHWIDNTHSY